VKNNITLLAVFALSCLLTACASTPASQYIMPQIKYKQSISVHIPKKAYLFWQHGQDQVGEAAPSYSGGGVEGIIVSMIQAEERNNNPSRYNFSYGKAQQAAFITYFRDALTEHHVFKSVELITNPAQAKPDGVLINVKFKSTRVSSFDRNYKITLTVDLTIKSNNSSFTRTYLTESDEGELFKSKSYNDQLVDVSQQMLNQLMGGIKQWAH
jgi:hypothetical protein